jgi:hypothetical protein
VAWLQILLRNMELVLVVDELEDQLDPEGECVWRHEVSCGVNYFWAKVVMRVVIDASMCSWRTFMFCWDS